MNKEEFIRRSGEIVLEAGKISDSMIILMLGEEGIAATLKGDITHAVAMLIGACEQNKQFELLFRTFFVAWADPELTAAIKDLCNGVEERPVPSNKK